MADQPPSDSESARWFAAQERIIDSLGATDPPFISMMQAIRDQQKIIDATIANLLERMLELEERLDRLHVMVERHDRAVPLNAPRKKEPKRGRPPLT
jgi:hypothetical protein